MLLIIRSNSISLDSRVNKYIHFLDTNDIPYHVLGWDRTGTSDSLKNTTFYKKRCGYNIGGMKAAYYRICWMLFCFKFLVKNRLEYDIIHGCDLDSTFPAIVYKMLVNKSSHIIFDVFDWFSATLYNQSSFIKKVFAMMEYFSIKYSNIVIVCEEERKEQIPYNIEDKLLILPNIPYFPDDIDFLFIDPKYQFENNKITLSYVGGFYNERFLMELLELAESGLVNLLIAGYGDSEIEKHCVRTSHLPNVYYAGKVDYKEGLKLMYNSDAIYAMYCKSNPNHIYAAPNKYYEAMFLSKPIISTCGTIVGDKIEKNNIGYVINENSNELLALLQSLKIDDLHKKGEKAFSMWNRAYKNYTQNFMVSFYQRLGLF